MRRATCRMASEARTASSKWGRPEIALYPRPDRGRISGRGKSMHAGGLSMVLALLLSAAQATRAPGLPEDAGLEPVRVRLEALLAGTTGAGLPPDVVVSRVRGGLAKGVPADRIERA